MFWTPKCFRLTFSELYIENKEYLHIFSSIFFLNKEHLHVHVHIYYRSSVLEKEYLHIFSCISNLEKQWYERVKCGLLICIKYIWISTITLPAKQNDSQRLGCNDCLIYDRNTKNGELIDFYLKFITVLNNIFVLCLNFIHMKKPMQFLFYIVFLPLYMNM